MVLLLLLLGEVEAGLGLLLVRPLRFWPSLPTLQGAAEVELWLSLGLRWDLRLPLELRLRLRLRRRWRPLFAFSRRGRHREQEGWSCGLGAARSLGASPPFPALSQALVLVVDLLRRLKKLDHFRCNLLRLHAFSLFAHLFASLVFT